MSYISCRFILIPKYPLNEILTSELADLGFESFVEEVDGLDAYIQAENFDKSALEMLIEDHLSLGSIKLKITEIAQQNWNAQWESDYPIVEIGQDCIVYAPFHQINLSKFRYPILISPKMSFGTGHHETTSLMLQAMLGQDLKQKTVLDMGCGTAVLAILAAKMQASDILAIDTEAIAVENSIENAAMNNVDIHVKNGNVMAIGAARFDLILANINKNTLLADMKYYSNALNKHGKLFISGFFESDVAELEKMAASLNLRKLSQRSCNFWAMLEFQI